MINLYLRGSHPSNIPSENRRFDAGRFRSGRGYGSGSGSVIWERRKREKTSAPPQASAGQLTPRFLPLSLSGRLLQVTVAISPAAAKGASKWNGFLRASGRKVPAGKCRIFKRCICRETFRLEQNQKTAKRLFRKPFSAGIWVVEATSE